MSNIVYNRAQGAASADVDGELVLISPLDRRCFALNGTATAVWRLLPAFGEDGADSTELVEGLMKSFRIDGATCLSEVVRLLHTMTEAGVVAATEGG